MTTLSESYLTACQVAVEVVNQVHLKLSSKNLRERSVFKCGSPDHLANKCDKKKNAKKGTDNAGSCSSFLSVYNAMSAAYVSRLNGTCILVPAGT